MPGRLAAARASREASERLVQMPHRRGSTASGLPAELDDASAGDTALTFSRVSGGRTLRKAGTEAGPASFAKQQDPLVSGPSVTFLVSSAQHTVFGTPTATAAALAQGGVLRTSSEVSVSVDAGVATSSASPVKSAHVGQSPTTAPVWPHDGRGGGDAPMGAGLPQASVMDSGGTQQQEAWSGSHGGNLRPQSLHERPAEPWVAAAGAGALASASISGAASHGAAASSVSNAGASSHSAVEGEQIWTATARTDRARPVGTPANAVPLRHSRLRVTGRRMLDPQDGVTTPEASSGSTHRAAARGRLPGETFPELPRAESAQSASAAAGSPDLLTSPVAAATACNVVAPNSADALSGRRSQRRVGGAPAEPSVAPVSGSIGEDFNSAASSFTMRQTPSDAEDEMLERARTRRAMRSVAAAAATAAAVMGGRAPEDSAATVAGRGAAPGGSQPFYKPPLGYGAGRPQAPADGAGGRVTIRLNHQPGHHRRLPNRHASMPAMQRIPGHPAAGGAGGGPGGEAGGPCEGGEPPLRPPLSGGFGPGGMSGAPDSPGNTSPITGFMGSTGAALSGGGGGGGFLASGLLRAPSDSPGTSQISATSSYVVRGLGSSAQPRFAHVQAPGGAAGPGGLPVSSSPSPAQQGPSQLHAAHDGAHVALQPAVIAGGAGSSGQHGSFEDEGARVTPAFVGGVVPGSLMQSHQSQLMMTSHHSGINLGAGDRPSHVSSRVLSGAHSQHSNNLAALHKAVERLMLQDSGLYGRVQASMKGISSLAKETNKLEFCRDASGATVINQYVVVKTLGRGAFGKVKLCLNTLDGQLYAVKMINRAHLLRQLQKPSRPLRRRAPPPRNTSDTGVMHAHVQRTQTDGSLSISQVNTGPNYPTPAQAAAPARASMDDTSPLAAIMREIAVMKKVDHPHVVRLHEVIDPPGSSYLMMVMEYCEGGCVMETRSQTGLTPLGEDTAREYFRQACMGLDYLHYNNVVHGDLKPENMLVSGSGLLKIADFGSSRFMGGDPNDATKTSCTPAFQSPEEISHMPVDPFSADLWALACCLYCFVFGRLPFVGSCVVDIYRAILTRPHSYPPDVSCSPALRDLLDRMLSKDPRKRLALREVGHHEWVTAGGSLPPLPCLQSLASSGEGAGEAPPPVIRVTHAEAVNAIDRSSLVSLIRARLKEKTCQPGEYLFKEGDEAHCVYMIMAGVVELTQHLRRPGHASSQHHHAGAGAPAGGPAAGGPGSGASGSATPLDGPSTELHGATDHDASFSVDLDESLTLDHPDGAHITEAMNIVDGKLHIDRQQAIEMRRRMQGNLLGENAEYVVEVKGPGSVIGEIGMDNATAAAHRVSARARGPVTVVKLTEENFFKALLAMYGGNAGGSAASTTLTASSVSEAMGRAGGGAGTGGGGGSAAAGGAAATPPLSAQQLMIMQYLEDSGSFASYPAPGAAAAPGGAAAGGRFSLDAGTSGRGAPGGYHHMLHPNRAVSAQKLQETGGAERAAALGSAAAAAAATGAPAAAAAAAAAGGGVAGIIKMSGAHSMLGVLNTIHSINASRAGGNTSEEGVADL